MPTNRHIREVNLKTYCVRVNSTLKHLEFKLARNKIRVGT